MAVKFTKPELNLREKISELDKPSGIAGRAMLAADTPQEQFNLISAGRRNRIINGDMRIDQRNAGASYTQVNSAYNLDRWDGNSYNGGAATSKFSVQQSTTAPAGFSNSLLVTSLATTADSQNDIFNIEQKIEGFNSADLAFGTASAKTITLSFWVRSSLTGTFGGAIKNRERDRAYPFAYTISSANTFEYKTITIAGDTSGTWEGSTNLPGLWLSFGLGVSSNRSNTAGAWAGGDLFSSTGAVRVIGTSGATFYVTGVQLEAGDIATPFEHRLYGEELVLCQRYYWDAKLSGSGSTPYLWATTLGTNLSYYRCNVYFTVAMRTSPTVTVTAATNGTFQGGMPGVDLASTTTVVVNCDLNQTNSVYSYVTSLKAEAEL